MYCKWTAPNLGTGSVEEVASGSASSSSLNTYQQTIPTVIGDGLPMYSTKLYYGNDRYLAAVAAAPGSTPILDTFTQHFYLKK